MYSNSAFCLPKNVLEDMISFQINRIEHGSGDIFYTELGPAMFHRVIMNRYNNIYLYSHNSPVNPSINDIVGDIYRYGHRQLHLSGHIRRGNSDLSFALLANEIRTRSGLPLLPV
jgi:hypothetical protein